MRYPGAKVKCINCEHLKTRIKAKVCYVRNHYRHAPKTPIYCLSFFNKHQTRLGEEEAES